MDKLTPLERELVEVLLDVRHEIFRGRIQPHAELVESIRIAISKAVEKANG